MKTIRGLDLRLYDWARASGREDLIEKYGTASQVYRTEKYKLELIKLAESGAPRPTTRNLQPETRRMAVAFYKYINKKHIKYDHNFTQKITFIRPDWIFSVTELKKQLILAEVRAGRPIPKSLKYIHYTCRNKKSPQYDKKFDNILEKLNPNLLNRPSKISKKRDKKHLLYRAERGYPPPCYKKEKRLYSFLRQCLSDSIFKNKITKINPEYCINRNKASLLRFLSKIPSFVEFDKKQTWIGMNGTYTFVCKKYGQFFGEPERLVQRYWKKGNSGHPKMSKERMSNAIKTRRSKPVLCIDTAKKYLSLTDASNAIGLSHASLGYAIKHKTKCAGFHWAYCDKDGNIIKL